MIDYTPPISEILKLGEPEVAGPEHWPDYAAEIGLGAEHIPELIRMAQDRSLDDLDIDDPAGWGSVHAWRVLGQLKAEVAIEPLMALFSGLRDSEWMWEELPDVYAMIGPAAIPALTDYLVSAHEDDDARATAAECLLKIAQVYPDRETECVSILTRQLEQFVENSSTLNAYLISDLIELKAVDTVSVIERAYQAERVDKWMSGDWEDVQIRLGLKTERETPKKSDSVADLVTGSVPQSINPGRSLEDKKAKTKRKQEKQSRKQNRKKKKRK